MVLDGWPRVDGLVAGWFLKTCEVLALLSCTSLVLDGGYGFWLSIREGKALVIKEEMRRGTYLTEEVDGIAWLFR